MGEVKGFLKYDRQDPKKQSAQERIKHWNEFVTRLLDEEAQAQGARCMDCGVPFCHSGCPLANVIPDWNDLVYQGRWEEAFERLYQTNPFPEFTGRICPALCENACTLGYNYPAVAVKNIEMTIVEKAYEKGWIKPHPPKSRTGRTVAVVGSGPAGLSCADFLNKRGHKVVVYEKNERPGGLLRFGIPDYKLDKNVIDRRLDLMSKEGVVFKTGVTVGKDISLLNLKKQCDAVVLSGGAEQPRNLPVEGRELKGVYFAMEYLAQQNRVNKMKFQGERIDVKGKKVVVIGGGDTGSDCVGTANRQGAARVVQIELLPRPPRERVADNPWPEWALIERTSTSHEEGCERMYAVMTRKFSGENGVLKRLEAVKLEFGPKDPKTGRQEMREIPGSEFVLECDFAFLALGFAGPVRQGMLEESGIALDSKGNVRTDGNYMSSIEGIFSAGDMRRGQSLVVWAINEGLEGGRSVHKYLRK
ncbi:MAG: glutamate synthase subunit beta [Candidatus Omnitrophota bacterium]